MTLAHQVPAAEKGGSLLQRVLRSRRRIATAAAIVLTVLLGYHVIFGQNGITVYQAKRREIKTLDVELKQMQQQNSRLKAHVERLESDPGAIEHEARARLHYARPGEVIYTLPDKPEVSTGKP